MKKAGGKRKGAGRKPLPLNKKKTIVRFYIENETIDKLGGIDKLKEDVLNFIDALNKA